MNQSSLTPTRLNEQFILIKNKPSYSRIVELLNFSALMLLVFCLPLYKPYIPYAIALWVLTWLLEGGKIKKIKINISKRSVLYLLMLPVLFYLMHVLSYMLSLDKHTAGFDLEVKLSLIVFPLIILSSNYLYKAHGHLILIAFIAGNVFASLIGIAYAFNNSIEFINGGYIFNNSVWPEFDGQSFFKLVGNRYSYFSYSRLSVFHHPSYFSMYINFAIVISYYLFKISKTVKLKIIYFVLIVFFYIMIYLLSSKAGLLSLLFVLISLTLIELKTNKNYLLVLLVSFTLLFGLYKAITVTAIESNIKEFNHELNTEETIIQQETDSNSGILDNDVQEEIETNDKFKNRNDRLVIWECALVLIKDNIFLGINTGDVKDRLVKEYIRIGYNKGVDLNYNAHNQYIESLLAGGFFMFLVLLIMLGYYFVYALSKKKVLMGLFISIIAINFLFESMYGTIAGVVFITLFYTFLLIYQEKEYNSSNR